MLGTSGVWLEEGLRVVAETAMSSLSDTFAMFDTPAPTVIPPVLDTVLAMNNSALALTSFTPSNSFDSF